VILYDTITAGKRGFSILAGMTGILEDDLVETNAVSASDEFTDRRRPLSGISFHGLMCTPGNRADAMGCTPHSQWVGFPRTMEQ